MTNAVVITYAANPVSAAVIAGLKWASASLCLLSVPLYLMSSAINEMAYPLKAAYHCAGKIFYKIAGLHRPSYNIFLNAVNVVTDSFTLDENDEIPDNSEVYGDIIEPRAFEEEDLTPMILYFITLLLLFFISRELIIRFWRLCCLIGLILSVVLFTWICVRNNKLFT